MDRMRMETPDPVDANIEKIAALFPNVVTEARDENGGIRRAVNFDLLRQILSRDLVEGDEAYDFTWVGKKAAILEAGRPIRKTLRPCREESRDWDTTENLYIEGDNLDALKLLQESYLGRIKMIYIDPPYNTGNDFVYRDSFAMSREDYDEASGARGEDGERLFRNTETNGRFHSDWCSMMYSRLLLARNLMSDDGLLFISIGDEEIDNLRKIADEIFGGANFRNQIIIRRGAKSVQAQFDTWDKLGKDYESILLYSKNSTYKFPKQTKQLDEKKEGSWNNHWRGTDRPTMRFELFGITPSTGQWRWGKEKSFIAIENYKRLLREIGSDTPTQQQIDNWWLNQENDKLDLLRLSQYGKPEHYIPPTGTTLLNSSWMDLIVGSSSEINTLFSTKVFDTAKLTTVVKRMLNFSDKDAIVLDFFSGSATTAHAVMQLNAEDGGKRRFIMVQLPEPCPPDSEAAKAGYGNICEIGKERIRRAGDRIRADLEAKAAAGRAGREQERGLLPEGEAGEPADAPSVPDTGFRVLRVDESNMRDVYYGAAELRQGDLMDLVGNIRPDRGELDLLFSCILEFHLPLTLRHTEEAVDGATVHAYAHPSDAPEDRPELMACFREDITEHVVRRIAARRPLGAVFRDACFAGSPARINAGEIFKALSPDTIIRVL